MTSCQIKLDYDSTNEQSESFNSGENLSGLVELTISSPMCFQYLQIVVTGTADCKWAGSENPKIKDEVKSFTAHDAFLLSTTSLVGSEEGDPIDLDIGIHSFIFSSPLPLNIPSSYESEYGNVSYKIEAIFHQPWRISHLRVKQDFNLVTFVDLNKDPSLKMPFYMETSKKIRSLLRSSKAMQLKVGIPFSGYVSGQKMRIMFDVENKSHSSVKNMLIHFVEVITLTSPKPNEMTKTIRKIILSMTAMGARKKSVDQFEADFTVPCDLVPVHCNIIKIDYEVEIVAKISSKMKKSPRFTIPIELGTVPLQFVDMRRKSSQSLLRLSSIPKMLDAPTSSGNQNRRHTFFVAKY